MAFTTQVFLFALLCSARANPLGQMTVCEAIPKFNPCVPPCEPASSYPYLPLPPFFPSSPKVCDPTSNLVNFGYGYGYRPYPDSFLQCLPYPWLPHGVVCEPPCLAPCPPPYLPPDTACESSKQAQPKQTVTCRETVTYPSETVSYPQQVCCETYPTSTTVCETVTKSDPCHPRSTTICETLPSSNVVSHPCRPVAPCCESISPYPGLTLPYPGLFPAYGMTPCIQYNP